jgi:rhodanese-related sulfurtransferase
MKKLILLALSLVLLVTQTVQAAEADATKKPDAAAEQKWTYKTPQLSRAKLDALLAKPAQLLIIDVRRPDEISKIGGFPVYLSIQSKDIENSLKYIPKDRKIVTVSNHAHRAGIAADLLASKGFKVVGAVGSQNYEEEGGVINKIEIPPPRAAAASTEAPKAEAQTTQPKI